MTDQAVDTSGPAGVAGASGSKRPSGATPPQFFGRERELRALQDDIGRAGLDTLAGRKAARARVLLIAGRPGSGRTALAAELARRLAEPGDYPDGVFRVALTDHDGARVPVERTARELLDLLAVPAPPGADEDELSEVVRAAFAERRALILLDDAVDAEQVDPLLPDNPDCLVVATSTGPLTGIPGVRPCTIGGMDAGSAVHLLARTIGQVRITVDPRTAETLTEECAGLPAALTLVAGLLAARPGASVADVTKQLRELPDDAEQPTGARPLARAFRLVHDSLPPAAARTLRLLALAPAGLADAHTASALAGCSVSAAQTTLDDFVRLGLMRSNGAEQPQYEVPGCLAPCSAPCWRNGTGRPRSSWPGPGCWSGPYASSSPAGRSPTRRAHLPAASSPDCPARCASPIRTPPPSGCGSGSPPCWPPPGSPSRTGSWTPSPADWSRHSSRRSPCTGAPRRPRPSCTGCTRWSWTWRNAATCTGRRPPRCSTSPTWTPGPAAPRRR